MHVLFLSTRSPYPLTGGHPLRTFHTLREAARRHRVSFLTFIQHEEEWEGLAVLKEFCDHVEAYPVPSDAGRAKLAAGLAGSMASSLPFVARKYDTPEMRRAIAAVCSRGPVDLVHLDMLPLSVYRQSVPGAPVVQVDHNVEYLLLERRAATEKGLARAFWRTQARRLKRFEAEAVTAADRTIAVSDIDAGLLRSLAPRARVRTVPNGVDINYFAPAGEGDPDELVFVGAMTHYPNVDSVRFFMEEIWPRVRERRPNARFTIIGAHPPAGILAYRSWPGVTVAGQVPDIRPYVAKASVYVVPLRVGGGTRLKILDAMSMGKAIVSTAVGCEGLEVTDGTDIAVEDRPDAFAARVLALMEDAPARAEMGRVARATVERLYGWDRLGELQEAVYQEAVRREAAP